MGMKGRDKHMRRLKRLGGAEVVKIAGRVAYVGADMIRAKAFQEISRGAVSGKDHVASLPGEYPNRDTGTLQAGFETRQTGPASAEFSSNAPYAADLEFKPASSGGRPHIRRARDSEEPKIQKLFASDIASFVKRSGT